MTGPMDDQDLLLQLKEEGRRIEALVQQLPEQIEAAGSAALEAHMTFDQLQDLHDVDLFDGQEGRDALHELAEAMRHLRNTRRIAEHRAHLYDDEAEEATSDG